MNKSQINNNVTVFYSECLKRMGFEMHFVIELFSPKPQRFECIVLHIMTPTPFVPNITLQKIFFVGMYFLQYLIFYQLSSFDTCRYL